MPDVFVPLDTTRYTKFFTAIRRHNIFNEQVLRYVDGQRKVLRETYPDFELFVRDFEVPAALLDSVILEAKRKKVEPKDSAELEETLKDLQFTLKSLIAYDVWDRKEYFKLINTHSDIVKAALRRWGAEK